MALTVKSRRAKSSSMRSVNTTLSGCRLSRYAPSRRMVVISTPRPPDATVTVPWRRPVGCAASPKIASTASGGASVVISQSSGVSPSSASRTQPPTG